EILTARQREVLAEKSEVDLSFGLEGLGRFRLAVFQQRGTLAMALRRNLGLDTTALKEGENVIAVYVRYYATPRSHWMPAKGNVGLGTTGVLVFEANLGDPSIDAGERDGWLVSDDSWRALKSDAWGAGPSFMRDIGRIDPSKTVRICFGEPLVVEGRGDAEHGKVVEFIGSKLEEWNARRL
ncbi:MAG: hypothetical protein P8Y85_00785, partial [Nitrospirota bacterium]